MLHDSTKKCRHCDESRPEAMTKHGLCYECMLIQIGRKGTEDHHPFGRDNEIVAAIPGNWHRALDARRAQRPEVLRRPGDNPLHQLAADVATLAEAASAVADFARRQRWPEWVAELANIFANAADAAKEWLLILAGKLDEWCGPAWIGEMPKWRP
jgi:hypothetical protein